MMTKRPTELHTALIGGHARIVSANLTQTIEALDFLKRRFERDRQMLTDLSHAPDSAAAVGVLTAFYQRSLPDYVAEAARLSSLIAATAEQVGTGVQDEVTALMGGTPRH
ncbi:MAG: hypothetical protein CFE34_04170 [Rhodobacteraceae bacterium PARR1]|nr:MAG: hypothetical protein CFE34_04170 [Rhodobacteraceae bacterium PARR1]